MRNDKSVAFYDWPNGMKNVAGGTRTEIKLSRPWQKKIKVMPENCPFCDPRRESFGIYAGWRVLNNWFTPFSYHRLLVPKNCWSSKKLHDLGGKQQIQDAFILANSEISKSRRKNFSLSVHIGSSAGQNQPHLHYHLRSVFARAHSAEKTAEKLRVVYKKKAQLVIYEDARWILTAGGIRAGQCFIISKQKTLKNEFWTEMPRLIANLLERANTKFRSIEGLLPEFALGFRFEKSVFQYGLYTPILNHWGAGDWMALYEKRCPVTIPWPHELTAKLLRESHAS